MLGTRGLPKAGLPELWVAPELGVAPKLSPIVAVGGASLGSDDGMLTSKIDQS